MTRTFIRDLSGKVGETVLVKGWVTVRRDQGKMVFFDLRDMGGSVQGVVLPGSLALETAKTTTVESAVAIEATVNKRPEKNIQTEKQNGDIELEIKVLTTLAKADTLPFELSAELNLETHLDNLPLTLRSERTRDIFEVQATILEAYRASLRAQGFNEFIAPALVGGDAALQLSKSTTSMARLLSWLLLRSSINRSWLAPSSGHLLWRRFFVQKKVRPRAT